MTQVNDTILVENNENIVTLTINRPKALNAINASVMSGLNEWFSEKYKEENGLRGVIITGSGDKAFVAGADIKGLMNLEIKEGMALSKYGQDTFSLIENFHVPVVAAVNGFALGGGCELAMACHIRIASNNAKFGLPEVTLGLIPGYGGTQRMAQLVGKGKAMELTLTGDMIDAEEASRLGLVNHTVTVEELMPKCFSILKKSSKKGSLAISKAIYAINASFDKQKDGFEEEYKIFGELLSKEECREGVSAFIEKRKPNFE